MLKNKISLFFNHELKKIYKATSLRNVNKIWGNILLSGLNLLRKSAMDVLIIERFTFFSALQVGNYALEG